MRLFVAVWPPEDVIDLSPGFRDPDTAGLRWTTRAQWHVTLRFLGEVADRSDVAEWPRPCGDLSGSGAVPMHAVLGPATAWFPGKRVLQMPVAGLEDLEQRVGQAMSQVGRPGPERP